MCIGIPMQVLEVQTGQALCANGDQRSWVDTRLVDNPDVGGWLLVFLGAAREVISAERAQQIGAALKALQVVASGERAAIDHLFADLIEREPQLPPHLQAMADRISNEDDDA